MLPRCRYLIQFGKLIRPGLGVSLVADALARRAGIRGVVIRKVFRGSAAERAGLAQNAVAGNDIRNRVPAHRGADGPRGRRPVQQLRERTI